MRERLIRGCLLKSYDWDMRWHHLDGRWINAQRWPNTFRLLKLWRSGWEF